MTSAAVAARTVVPRADILLAYRHSYKALLRAVQYAKPARFTARDRVRAAFRTSAAGDFDAVKLGRTIAMLDHAATTRGLEHRVVKNLMHAWWERERLLRNPFLKPAERASIQAAYGEFDRTIQALNESMGLCIK